MSRLGKSNLSEIKKKRKKVPSASNIHESHCNSYARKHQQSREGTDKQR